MEFGDGSVQRAAARAASRASTRPPCARSATSATVDAIYLCAGGKDGYVGRDGRVRPGEEERVRAIHDLSAEQPAVDRGAARGDASRRRGAAAARQRRARDPAGRDHAAHEPLLRPRRPARERHRLARGSDLRRARLARRSARRSASACSPAPARAIVAVAQDERSQARNRELALARLAERLAQRARGPARPPRDPPDRRLARAASAGQARGRRAQAAAAQAPRRR